MKVSAQLNNLRISPRKVRLVVNLIKGLDLADALVQLDNRVKASSQPIKKLLKSAVSNAENNFGLDKDNLYVFNILVGSGTTLKRWMPRAYGRAASIRKRTSKVYLILEERIEGKGRKTKEQMEKERAQRLAEKRKTQKEAEKKLEEKKSIPLKKTEENKEIEKTGKGSGKGSWSSKIFRRKSM